MLKDAKASDKPRAEYATISSGMFKNSLNEAGRRVLSSPLGEIGDLNAWLETGRLKACATELSEKKAAKDKKLGSKSYKDEKADKNEEEEEVDSVLDKEEEDSEASEEKDDELVSTSSEEVETSNQPKNKAPPSVAIKRLPVVYSSSYCSRYILTHPSPLSY